MKLFGFILLIGATTAWAQLNPGNPLAGLEKLKDFDARRMSSADPDWKNGNKDWRPIAPGATLTLAELNGPGEIVHIWCTVSHADPNYSRMMIVRMYWDGEKEPSVECPLGDFFGMGHGIDKEFTSIPVRVSSNGRGRNCYWPMPFRKSARITISNDSDKPCRSFYYYVDWQKRSSIPKDTAYFHAMYRQEFPCVMGQNYLLADIQGRGHYVGTVQSVYLTSPGWYGEGDDFFFIDGEREPSLRGTGTEDYFCDGWGFREQSGPFYGTPLWEGENTGGRGSAYRWHIPDPIPFKKSLRVEIEHKGSQHFPDGSFSGFIERDDLMSSVAYWYQTEPHKPWAPMPPASERLPFHDKILVKGNRSLKSATHSESSLQLQGMGGTSDGKQLWFRATNDESWLEIPFKIDEAETITLFAKMVHAPDYGNYTAKLDGKVIAKLDLYAEDVAPASHPLGQQTLAAGPHTLRFEGHGKNLKSGGYFLGFDALSVRVPVYSRAADKDLRTLQVTH